MSDVKKYTAKEAAIAVLNKTKELLEKNELSKAEKTKHDRCVEQVKENSPKVDNPHAVCVAAGVEPETWKKSENVDISQEVEKQPAPENNPDEKKEGNNEPWGTDPKIRGYVKLAKFCGYIQARRSLNSAPKEIPQEIPQEEPKEDMEKGDKNINEPVSSKNKIMSPNQKADAGTSHMGLKVRNPELGTMFSAKDVAQKELKRIKDQPKPNLGKAKK